LPMSLLSLGIFIHQDKEPSLLLRGETPQDGAPASSHGVSPGHAINFLALLLPFLFFWCLKPGMWTARSLGLDSPKFWFHIYNGHQPTKSFQTRVPALPGRTLCRLATALCVHVSGFQEEHNRFCRSDVHKSQEDAFAVTFNSPFHTSSKSLPVRGMNHCLLGHLGLVTNGRSESQWIQW
jgi:hypothetical protein